MAQEVFSKVEVQLLRMAVKMTVTALERQADRQPIDLAADALKKTARELEMVQEKLMRM